MRVARATDQPNVTKWTFCVVQTARGDRLLSFWIFSCLLFALKFIMQLINPVLASNVVGNCLENWKYWDRPGSPWSFCKATVKTLSDTWHPELYCHDKLAPNNHKNFEMLRLFERPCENCIHYHVSGCPMTGNVYRLLGPSKPVFEAFPAQ